MTKKETREVYIGNGVTIEVELREKERWNYDYDKINELVEKYGKIEVGMRIDWDWTAEDIDKKFPSNREFDKLVSAPIDFADERLNPFRIAGIIHSDWDTPVARTPDGKVEVYRRMEITLYPNGFTLREIKE
mgnify:CR=1 FL=1